MIIHMMPFRAFISVDIEPNTLLENFSRRLAETKAPLKIVKLDNIHLTLKFLGDTDEALIPSIREILKAAVEGLEPFTIHLVGTGAFPSINRIKVIWIGVEDADPLDSISKFVDEELHALGFKKEKRGFSPHVTIARMRSGRDKGKIQRVLNEFRKEEFGDQLVDNLRLKKSVLGKKGPTYSTIEEAKF